MTTAAAAHVPKRQHTRCHLPPTNFPRATCGYVAILVTDIGQQVLGAVQLLGAIKTERAIAFAVSRICLSVAHDLLLSFNLCLLIKL